MQQRSRTNFFPLRLMVFPRPVLPRASGVSGPPATSSRGGIVSCAAGSRSGFVIALHPARVAPHLLPGHGTLKAGNTFGKMAISDAGSNARGEERLGPAAAAHPAAAATGIGLSLGFAASLSGPAGAGSVHPCSTS